jgi:signal transduction histidine kinase
MLERKSLKWPILLAIFMIVVLVGLTVGWILLNVFGAIASPSQQSSTVYWVLLSVGSIMFAFVLTGVILYLIWTIQNINLNRRQSNFIDAVTHELKTPIASLKLYLQTLNRHQVEGEQRQQFYRTMMDDVERLDRLISQLLDVARIQHKEKQSEPPGWIRVDQVVREVSEKLATEHQIQPNSIRLQLNECEVLAHKVDVEILVRNLMDNAIKYAGTPPEVDVAVQMEQTRVQISISDNGSGIPRKLRRKVFARFYRAGNELERNKPGTGLGLFLVRSTVKRLKGTVRIVDQPKQSGSKFVVSIPNARPAKPLPPT